MAIVKLKDKGFDPMIFPKNDGPREYDGYTREAWGDR